MRVKYPYLFQAKECFPGGRTGFIYVIAFLLIASSCANMAPLGGGEKDVNPPVLLVSEPQNQSTGFSSKRIILEFDEFVQVKSLQQKLVVSPPMNKVPEVREKGKKLEIILFDTLKPNTTYVLNFGDAIVDLNESNPIDNFRYVFSTGETVDSLQASGTIVNALTNDPEKGMLVFLYKGNGDSLPVKELPYYISKTDASGKFTFTNLHEGSYKLFALADINTNFLFDMSNERIAFSDELIVPSFRWEEKTDTLGEDSIVTSRIPVYLPDSIKLCAFDEDNQKQYVKRTDRATRQQGTLIMNRKPFGKVDVIFENAEPSDIISEQSKFGDTLVFWFKNEALAIDSLQALITYSQQDSLEHLRVETDTILFAYHAARFRGKPVVDADTLLTINCKPGNNALVHPDQKLLLQTNLPVQMLVDSLIGLYSLVDSIEKPQLFSLERDSLSPRCFYLSCKWVPETSYLLKLKKGAMVSSLGVLSDSLQNHFSVPSTEQYGNLSLSITCPNNAYVFQLTDQKGNVLEEWKANGSNTRYFKLLKPAVYKLKAIADENRNGKWDTGRYILHRQPETIIISDKSINIRANWDLEETWSF